MLVKDLIKELKKYNQNAEINIGSDEELNNVYTNIQVAEFETEDTMDVNLTVIVYPVGKVREE